MRKAVLLVVCIVYSQIISAQVNGQIKVMAWNVLNWPIISNIVQDTTSRCPSYRTVINYTNPDVLVTMENTASYSIPWFLNQVMNADGPVYQAGTFINGYDTDNGIFYKDSLFTFVSNQPIQTFLRDINHYTLIYKSTGDTLHIFAVHLKAGQGYESERASEIVELRNVTNAFNPGQNFMVAGDFNIYGDYEPAYTALLQDNPGDDGHFIDVLNLTGTWNNSLYARYHTQSTRLNAGTSGSGGGMDDRFDMILYSNGIAQPTGYYYVPGSYENIGNDGQHYNKSVNFGINTSVPSSVANALFNASDHLPVSVLLSVGPTAEIGDIFSKLMKFEVYPLPLQETSKVCFTLKESAQVSYFVADISGRVLIERKTEFFSPGYFEENLEAGKFEKSGFYFISMKVDNYQIFKKLVVVK